MENPVKLKKITSKILYSRPCFDSVTSEVREKDGQKLHKKMDIYREQVGTRAFRSLILKLVWKLGRNNKI